MHPWASRKEHQTGEQKDKDLSPIENKRKRERGGRKEEGKEEGRRGYQNPQEGQDLFIVCSSKRTAGITHSQIESRPKSVGTKWAETWTKERRE
jgi:hypothetical protein